MDDSAENLNVQCPAGALRRRSPQCSLELESKGDAYALGPLVFNRLIARQTV